MAWFVPGRSPLHSGARGEVHLHARLAFSLRRGGSCSAWFPRTTRVLIAAPARIPSKRGDGRERPVAAAARGLLPSRTALAREAASDWRPVARVVAATGAGGGGDSGESARREPAAAPPSAGRSRPPGLTTSADVEAPLSDWEVRRLSDRVLETMDRRLVAYRERRGRS